MKEGGKKSTESGSVSEEAIEDAEEDDNARDDAEAMSGASDHSSEDGDYKPEKIISTNDNQSVVSELVDEGKVDVELQVSNKQSGPDPVIQPAL